MFYFYPDSEDDDTNIYMPYEVTLEDLYKGKTAEIEYDKRVLCKPCKGFGILTCYSCSGKGITFQSSTGYAIRCRDCNGSGKSARNPCLKCKGKPCSYVKAKTKFEISKGMADEAIIPIRKAGHEGVNGSLGNVYVKLECAKHDVFDRIKDDLFVTKKISLSEALCGSKLVVEHIDGRKLNVRVNKYKPLYPGSVWQLAGQGMPKRSPRNMIGFGDLYIKIDVEFPKNIPESDAKKLSSVFPAKSLVTPVGEEVTLQDFDGSRYKEGRREAYDDDDTNDHWRPGPPPECAHM